MDDAVDTSPRHRAPSEARSAGRNAWLLAGALTVLAFLVRLVGLDHTPHLDEIYHTLAARSWLADGSLRLSPDGMVYSRARLFTQLVGISQAFFGESLWASRLPAAASGAALTGAVFVGTHRYGDPLSAWFAALMVMFGPVDLYLSQIVRFYTPHALLVWVAAFSVFALASDRGPDRRRVLGLVLVAGGALALAYHLQMSTALAGLALAVGGGAVALWTFRAHVVRVPWWLWVGLAAVLVVALFAVLETRFGVRLIRSYRPPRAVTIGRDPSARYYFDYFQGLFGLLWAGLPFLAAAAFVRRRRFTAFLALFALVSFIAVSFSTWRHARYVYFAMPAVYMLWALGSVSLLAWLRDAWRKRLSAGSRTPAEAGRLAFLLTAASALVAGVFAAPTIDAVVYSARMLTVSDADWTLGGYFRGEADWERAIEGLGADTPTEGTTVVASSPHKATFYLGDVDYVLLGRALRDGELLGVDGQWNRPEIATPSAMAAVLACHPDGIVLVEEREWRRPEGVPSATADYLEATLTQVPTPPGSRMVAFRWSSDRPTPLPPDWACGDDGRVSHG